MNTVVAVILSLAIMAPLPQPAEPTYRLLLAQVSQSPTCTTVITPCQAWQHVQDAVATVAVHHPDMSRVTSEVRRNNQVFVFWLGENGCRVGLVVREAAMPVADCPVGKVLDAAGRDVFVTVSHP